MKMNILKTILENEEYLKDFITRSTYNSNAIDGNKLTHIFLKVNPYIFIF